MTCNQVREQLSDILFGHGEPDQRDEIAQHLAECAACRHEHNALTGMRELLNTAPPPTVSVDLTRIYHEAAAAQEKRTRRWRRVACSFAVAAVLLVGVSFLLRLEVRIENHQMVLRWGSPPEEAHPEPVPPPSATRPSQEELQRLVAVEDQLRLMSQIVHALAGTADEADARDRQRQRDLAQLRERLDDLQRQNALRWLAAREYAEALFIAKLSSPKQGDIP